MTTVRHTSYRVYNKKIRALRNQKRLTQEELAHKADISLSSIKSLENSSSQSFRIETIRKIASPLDIDVRELIKEKATMDIEVEINDDTFNDEAVDMILQKKVNDQLKDNRRMIDELLDRSNQAYQSGQIECAVNVGTLCLDKLRLNSPISMTEICSTIMSQAQALASVYPDKEFMKESKDIIHWIGNVLYTLPRDILTTHIDRERIWTFMINSAYCVSFFDGQDEQDEQKKQHNQRIQERYLCLIESLTPARFYSSTERVDILLQVFFFFDENWSLCQFQSSAYITLSLLFCLLEDDPISDDDFINLDRATTVIFFFLYALENANSRKPPFIKDK